MTIGGKFLSTRVGLFPVWLGIANVFEGLARGCSSTEADVWLINGTLYVRFSIPFYTARVDLKGRP